jgi:hypothetical protein
MLLGTVAGMNIWKLDLQLPVQSVPITTKVVSLNPAHGEVLDTAFCDKVCQRLETGCWFSLGTPFSSTNKTEGHNITEILLKVKLNTITQSMYCNSFSFLQN